MTGQKANNPAPIGLGIAGLGMAGAVRVQAAAAHKGYVLKAAADPQAGHLDSWRLDDWMGLLTEDAAYYVRPNDKPDGDYRYTLFDIAANFDIFRYRRNEPPREFVGRYCYKLRRCNGALEIAERRAILDAEELGALSSVNFLL